MANGKMEVAPALTREQQSAIAAFEQKYGVTLGRDIASKVNLHPSLWSSAGGAFEKAVESVVERNYKEVAQKNPGLAEWYADRAQAKAEGMYRKAMGEKCDMNRFAQVSVAASIIFTEVCHTDAAMGQTSRVLPQKYTEKPAPQLREKFKAELAAATGKTKEQLASSDKPADLAASYYQYVKSALYEEIKLPEAKMPHLPGDELYATDPRVPKTVRDKVVLNQEERKNFESWLDGKAELGHNAWNKVKFAMGITDSWSRYASGEKADAQLNAYRDAMAEKGCDVLKMVYKTEEYFPVFMALAKVSR